MASSRGGNSSWWAKAGPDAVDEEEEDSFGTDKED